MLVIRKYIQYPVTILFKPCIVIAEYNRITAKRIVCANYGAMRRNPPFRRYARYGEPLFPVAPAAPGMRG
ncbi:hypothetical protein LJ928_000365 [Salmonella enterica]|nr:hypothetical protein [Salmonella enterica]EIJ0686111.1 hypothetical protein [Salmonella enterica]EIJ6076178.1 hypothetical protein [Salmonella enterica]EIJ6081302.1 hypothetical protein [Salmonella enterica]EIJ6391528.1 hypothetical protein [Salmonella enterica]